MYAVIETGGKQYRVELGTELEVELLDVEPGQEITIERVLLVADGEQAAVGRPVVADATVSARVLRRDRGEKTISFKYRPKARSRVKKGHRQELTVLRITDVRLGDKSAAAEAQAVESQAEAERERIANAAARQAAEDAALAARLAKRTQPAPEPEIPAEASAPEASVPEVAAPAEPAPEGATAEPAADREPAPEAEPKDAPGPVQADETSGTPAPRRRGRTKKDE